MAYPNWDEQTMRKRTHRRLLVLSGLAVIMWIALIGWIFWWLPLPDQSAAANPAKLTDFLAALTIVAVLIERVLETGFRIVQGVWRPAVAYYSHGMRWLRATEIEEAEAREWLQNVSTFYNNLRSAYNRRLRDLLAGTLKIDPLAPVPEETFVHMDDLKKEAEFRLDAAKAMVDDAQQHLDEAENKLDSMMCHPRYRGAKAVVAIIVGPLIGVTLAAIGRWSMLTAAGLTDVPPRMDIFVTGLVLGTSSLPAHAAITNVGELISRIGGGGKGGGGQST
jgi:hypothetical protein